MPKMRPPPKEQSGGVPDQAYFENPSAFYLFHFTPIISYIDEALFVVVLSSCFPKEKEISIVDEITADICKKMLPAQTPHEIPLTTLLLRSFLLSFFFSARKWPFKPSAEQGPLGAMPQQ